MDTIFAALADPAVRGWYLAFCLAVMVVPPVALRLWYHAIIGQSRGGRDLMKEQARIGVGTWRSLQAIRMARDIASERYGAPARRLQGQVYWLAGCWMVVTALAFGILMWADEVNRATN